jgi:hypothetical protein
MYARVVAANIAVEYVKQFAVYIVKVLAHDYSVHGGSRGDDVNDLRVYFIPQEFGIAPQHCHIHFKVNVAHFDVYGILVERYQHALFILEIGRAVMFNGDERLRIFSDPGWTVEYGVWHFRRRVFSIQCCQIRMQIESSERRQILVEMVLQKFHRGFYYYDDDDMIR